LPNKAGAGNGWGALRFQSVAPGQPCLTSLVMRLTPESMVVRLNEQNLVGVETCMTTRSKVALATVSALGLAAALLVVRTQKRTEPIFEGRSLTAWLRSADADADKDRVDFAVVSLGEPAILSLRHRLQSGSRTQRLLYQFLPNRLNRLVAGDGWTLYPQRERTLGVLERIGPHQASQAHPELLAMARDWSEFPELRRRAIGLLVRTCADPKELIPVLKGLMNDREFEVRQSAGRNLFFLERHKNDASERRTIAAIEAKEQAGLTNKVFSDAPWRPDVSLIGSSR
jgi:hypothetical protein